MPDHNRDYPDKAFHPARRVDGQAFVASSMPFQHATERTYADGRLQSVTGSGGYSAARQGDGSFGVTGPDGGSVQRQYGTYSDTVGDVLASEAGYKFNATGGNISGDGPPRGSWQLPHSKLNRS